MWILLDPTVCLYTYYWLPHLVSQVGGDILHNSIYSWQARAGLGYNNTTVIVSNHSNIGQRTAGIILAPTPQIFAYKGALIHKFSTVLMANACHHH